jgi:hypothetical protein
MMVMAEFKVELRPAYEWTCPECGKDQFERGIVVELSEEEMSEMRWDHGIDEESTGNWMEQPNRVMCKSCGLAFFTIHYNDDDGDTESCE